MPRFTLQTTVKHTLEIKKSRFITWLIPLQEQSDYKHHLEQARQQYPDARHHCWAYVYQPQNAAVTAAMSDDGEPSGTAGKPMLNVLQHKNVDNVMAIVIRYFGGIKLGAGGLVRAYSQAIEQSFQLAQLSEIIPKINLTISCQFPQEQWLRHILSQHQATITNNIYANEVTLDVTIAEQHLQSLNQSLAAKSIVGKIRQP